jgi:hypothetical protein
VNTIMRTPRKAQTQILASEPHALPPELAEITKAMAALKDRWWERLLDFVGLTQFARRSRRFRRAWKLFRLAPPFAAVITAGDLEGLAFSVLQRFRRKQRPVHVMCDCLWYGAGWLGRAWMRFCLGGVDCCVVWASVERKRYARAYGVEPEKFLYVPHHHTMRRYTVEERDLGFVFTGGNADRDYGFFFDAIRDLNVPCVLATNQPRLPTRLEVPPTVQVQSLSPAEFRQRMAEARIVVMPMRATLLHAGAQQSILNAMLMGKAVVLTDPEGGSDYIENRKTGLLVPYGDVRALQQAIRFLLEHPEERRAMGERARLAASPLTTERCNTLIWTHTLQLISKKCGATFVQKQLRTESQEAKTSGSTVSVE